MEETWYEKLNLWKNLSYPLNRNLSAAQMVKRIQAFNSVLHAVRFTKIQTQTALYISLLKTILVFEIGRLLPDLLP